MRRQHWAGYILAAILLLGAAAFGLLIPKAAEPAGIAPLDELRAIANNPNVSPLKRQLVRDALAHTDELETFTARTLYYHPREAGAKWRDWAGTATGTLVRPGVASCASAAASRYYVIDKHGNKVPGSGAWIWFEGHGLTKVEDVFPESKSPVIFDLAVWADPGQSYSGWIWDDSKVSVARNRNVWTTAVIIKPRGGWEH